jgi:hypothetical protein
MMSNRAEELLERIAVGIEKLGDEPEFEIPTAPPVCPRCGKLNPVIHASENSGTGPMAEMFIQAQCTHCGCVWFAVPQGFVNFETEDDLRTFFERAENGNGTEAR